MATVLKAATLSVLHYMLTLRDIIYFSLFFVWRSLPGLSTRSKSLRAIAEDSKSIPKLPLHIGLVVLEDDINFTDVANIILWCMAMGISHISVYDRTGICKQQKKTLQEHIEHKKHKDFQGQDSSNTTLVFHDGRVVKSADATCTSSNTVHVYLLSVVDGRQILVNTCRYLSSEVAQKRFRLEDINPTTVDNLVQGSHNFPDPDMVIRFGATESLLGFLPWQIRLTEIFSMTTHHSIDYSSLQKVISSYGETMQRFGK